MVARLGGAVLLALAACGCAGQERAQQELVTQLERGVEGVGEFCDARQRMIEENYAQRREMLDAAFDEDVKNAEALDAVWVIEHRKAYAAGMEAIWNAQRSADASHRRAMANLQAVNDGLERLRWMSAMRENWAKMFEAKTEGGER